MVGSSYPLDDVRGALPGAAEHTALKEPFFFGPRESHLLARTPSPFPEKHPSPPFCCRPPAPSCLLPLAADQVLHVAGLGQVGGRPPAPVLRRHLFSSGMRVCWCWQGGAEG